MTIQNQNPTIFQFPQVRVVEASAGSGKTYTLAKRYIQLLLNPALKPEEIPLRQILAITFTNKAALEMKERILNTLKKIALNKLPLNEEKDIILTITDKKEMVQEKAFRIMDHLIHHYNFFQVQTIDSFIKALLAGCAFRIDLSANFTVKRETAEYLQFSLDELIDRAPEDKKVMKLFDDFLHQYLFIEERSSWFPKKDMLDLISTLFNEENHYGYAFKSYDHSKAKLGLKKKQVLKHMRELKKLAPEKTDKRFMKSLESFLSKDHLDINGLPKYFNREEFPVNKGGLIQGKVEKLWEEIRSQLKDVCEEEAFSLFNCYIGVFEGVIKNFQDLAGREDILFLAELNRKARRLFDEEGITVAELYYRMATRFRHYLVDEFQDTSILQWRNLHLMVEEALSTGGSLFYVGDKKQAIYGFRGGEVALFDRVKETFQAFNVQREVLARNYRSQKAIVEFNNQIFSSENLGRFIVAKQQYDDEGDKKDTVGFDEADTAEILDVFRDSKQTHQEENNKGYVNVEFVEAQNKDELHPIIREKLISHIRELKSRFNYSDIAILTRDNEDIELMTSWLLEEGLLVESERTSNIKENFLIKELISFLRFLNSPIDNLAFTSFILSEMFLKVSALKPEAIREFVFHLKGKMKAQRDLYAYKEFREAFPKVWDVYIDEFFRNVGLFPLYELVVSMIGRWEALKNFPEYQGFIMKFLELIKNQEEENADIASFLEYFENAPSEDLYVNASDTDAIKILTVHKSKGLEFPVVIIPFLEMKVKTPSGAGQGQRSYNIQFANDHLQLIHLKKKYLGFSQKLKAIYHQEYKKNFLAELDNVYVALTRAEKELYVFIPLKSGQSFNLTNLLIPQDNLEWGERIRYPAKEIKERSYLIKLPPSQYEDWLHLLSDEFTDAESVINREKMRRGEILHFVLSYLGNLDGQDKDEQLKGALVRARTTFPLVADFKDYESAILHLLRNEQLKIFFYVKDGQVFQEKDIVDPSGRSKRIDRLIIKKDEVWIIDYKSAREGSEQYQSQVKDYMEIVRGLFPRRKVKGFLIYLDERSVEEIYE